ncbi:MAG: dTDP-4-dehydrorhamnose 3,5-epimerase [Betaproteobacteria bacterium TMED41]|nr:MAG: dTDP-4-dehydrorhamnose 3,5-epimerase [Betaproteobacteria bacterium TMED41]
MKCSNLGVFTEVKVIQNTIHEDKRGFFLEAFNKKILFKYLSEEINFVQDNHSRSKKGVIRGLHFQRNPFAQAKLIRVTKGAILDVVVDIRLTSKNFGKWASIEINEKNAYMLFIPEGFAHGFLTIENNTDVLYKTNNFYTPDSDGSLLWNDPDIGINWELKSYKIENPIISKKDRNALNLGELNEKKLLFP